MSQRRLAEQLGFTQSTLSRLETGELVLSIDDVVAAATALQLSPSALVGGSPESVNRRFWRTCTVSQRVASLIPVSLLGTVTASGGSLRALRLASLGRQPLAVGQAAVALAVVGVDIESVVGATAIGR